MAEEFEINALKGLSKQKRAMMSKYLLKDPELYNAINGVGGLDETAAYGMVSGTCYTGTEVLKGVDVTVSKSGKAVKTTKTNQYGFYRLELDPDTYMVKFNVDGIESDETEVVIVAGKSETLDYDTEEVKPPAPEDPPAPPPPDPPEGGGE